MEKVTAESEMIEKETSSLRSTTTFNIKKAEETVLENLGLKGILAMFSGIPEHASTTFNVKREETVSEKFGLQGTP